MFIDLSALQSLPLSNPNRDDLGQPKTCTVGGVTRSRISSQSVKQQIRQDAEGVLGDRAVRTRRAPQHVAKVLTQRGWTESAAVAAGQALIKAANIKGLAINDEGSTTGMLFLPEKSLEDLADLVERDHQALLAAAKAPAKAKEMSQEVSRIISAVNPSIALFGRMLANSNASSVDGALAVQHAYTTHRAVAQPDYFTAVDDIPTDGEAAGGGAHLGTAAYTSGLFYRFASLDTRELLANLRGDVDAARKLTAVFLEKFAMYYPHAKKNSTAPFSLPELVLVTVRNERPVSLDGAFEAAVAPGRHTGYAQPSIEALEEYVEKLNKVFPRVAPAGSFYTGPSAPAESMALGTATESLDAAINEAVTLAYAPTEQQ